MAFRSEPLMLGVPNAGCLQPQPHLQGQRLALKGWAVYGHVAHSQRRSGARRLEPEQASDALGVFASVAGHS